MPILTKLSTEERLRQLSLDDLDELRQKVCRNQQQAYKKFRIISELKETLENKYLAQKRAFERIDRIHFERAKTIKVIIPARRSGKTVKSTADKIMASLKSLPLDQRKAVIAQMEAMTKKGELNNE